MTRAKSRTRRALAFFGMVGLGGLAWVWSQYGRGARPYVDVTESPLFPEEALEVAVQSDEPIGNVAVSSLGRVFFTVHPESRAPGPKLYEAAGGQLTPFPDPTLQESLFVTPLGIVVDRRDQLWVIDHGQHGSAGAGLFAFSPEGGLVFDHRFSSAAAPLGSFLQDVQIHPDGHRAYIADVSFLRRRPGIVVLDLESHASWRHLEGHPSVSPQPWLIRTPTKAMRFFGGLMTLRVGIDGITISPDGQSLAFGAMNHNTLFRLPTRELENGTDPAAAVVALGAKPLSDGLSTDLEGNILITDIEHGAVLRLGHDGRLETLIKSPRVRWADALSFGPEGWLYLADSAIPDQMLRSRRHIRSAGPYAILKFQPGIPGVPGH